MIKIYVQVLILSIFFNSFLLADMQIEITRGTKFAQPIAVIPFASSIQKNQIDSTENDVASIISSDLRNSGKFNTLPISYLPNLPTKINDVIPTFWEKLGINTIVLGTINVNDNSNEYTISYQLIDSSNNPALIILENQYSVQKKWLRYIAHTISNEIFEKLTGIKGAFCTHIAYVTHNTTNIQYPYELYISDYDGYNKISICQSSEPLMSPTWSPDGKKIAYVTFSSGYSELVIQTLNTGVIQNTINFPRHNGAPAFSPDGKKLAFSSSKTGSLNLYIMNLISGEIQQLTDNNNNNTEPSWFPDSTSLAYTSDQSGTPQIYKININDTINVQRLSWLHSNNQKPNVSNNGEFIIAINSYQGVQKILKIDLIKNQESILTNTFLDDTPSIAPNDTMIAYSTITHDTSTSNLQLISVDGKFATHIAIPHTNIKFPTWSPFCT